jgi:hypothetical protein
MAALSRSIKGPIDLSGGGNLQAEEWVPGTGGTRDVLSQYNAAGVPTNMGASNIYAILPGKQAPVAAYDPMLAQTIQPSTTNGGVGTTTASSLLLVGRGTFDVEAGRDIGPFTKDGVGLFRGNLTGIEAIGNTDNPNLPHQSANVQVLFGVAPGIDDNAFIASYIDPNTANATGVPSQTTALINFMEQYDEGQGVDTGLTVDAPAKVVLTAGKAWSQFRALPKCVQQLFVEQIFFSVLTDVGNDFNNPASPFFSRYARGFTAINTLFGDSQRAYLSKDEKNGLNDM